jgi:hypothetical protein
MGLALLTAYAPISGDRAVTGFFKINVTFG